MSFFSSNGSPIWTVGRFSSPSSSSAEASTEAPPIPSRPVEAPIRTTALPTPAAAARTMSSVAREARGHRVHQAILLVGPLEVDLAADGRDPDRVPVVADPGDDVLEEVAGALGAQLAEAQRVEHADRPRPEGEHVAKDPADARRCALEGLDRARVVVRLDLEGDRVAVPDVDRAGVLPGSHHDPRALGGEPSQELLRVLVGAVLRPEQREHRELDLVRFAAHQLDDPLVLGVGQPQRPVRSLAGRRHRAHPTHTRRGRRSASGRAP